MIVWINGAFGAGKSTTARELIDLLPGSTLYDPELTAAGLRALLPPERLGTPDGYGYPELPIWRRLVVDTAAAMLAELGGVLVVPMTLLRQEHRDEIFGGLAARRIPVCQVLLRPDETILRHRTAARTALAAATGALTHPSGAEITGALARPSGAETNGGPPERDPDGSSRTALDRIGEAAFVLDTSALDPRRAAERIADALRTGEAPVCEIVQTPHPTGETVAAGVLLFDEEDRVLLVDPTYKPGWEFPGGVVEPGEAPARAGMREVAEELGIALEEVPRLLVVDWEAPRPPRFGGLRLLFDGGRLGADRARRVLLPGAELRGWRFVGEDEARGLLPPVRYERLRWALRARERGSAHYLEAGVPV
ncbi:NUDIX domain-containing protein [Streptomyces sp. NPDC000594]|uniref:NUDIX hydrolase n=1 Tax=Streptomyces sp. NPDC000594 TaxID=3154261 RepID=UPI0033273F85